MIKIPSVSTPTGADAELITLGILLERAIEDRTTWNPIIANLDDSGQSRWSVIQDRIDQLVRRILTCRPTTAAGLGVQATAISLHFQDIWDGGDEDGDWVRVRHFIESVCNFCGAIPVRLKPSLNGANDSDSTVRDTNDSDTAV
jgi:hypothetical protein